MILPTVEFIEKIIDWARHYSPYGLAWLIGFALIALFSFILVVWFELRRQRQASREPTRYSRYPQNQLKH